MTTPRSTGFVKTAAAFAAVLMLGSSLTALPAFAQDAAAPADQQAAPAPVDLNAVVATVGDMTITEGDLAMAAEDLGQQLQQVPPEQQKAFLVTVLIDMKVMAAAALKTGVDQTEDYKRRVAYQTDKALRREFFTTQVAPSVTDDTLKAAYEKYKADFKPEEEVHARHILVATKEEADAIKKELDGGKPFEVLAMEKTTDPSGKQNGGDLGFFRKGQMVKEFEDVAFTLEPGKISDPVQSQFGWHIIKVEEKKMSEPEAFDAIKQQLGQQAIYQAYDAAIAKYKADLPVKINDATLAGQVEAQQKAADAAAGGQ